MPDPPGDFSALLDAHGAPTPYRRSKLTLDVPESVLVESAYYSARFRGEIAPSLGMRTFTSGNWDDAADGAKPAYLWPCGCWTNSPLPYNVEQLIGHTSADTISTSAHAGVFNHAVAGPESALVPMASTDPNTAEGLLLTPTVSTVPMPEVASTVPSNLPPLSDHVYRRNVDLSAGRDATTYPLRVRSILAPPVATTPAVPYLAPPTLMPAVPPQDMDPVLVAHNLPPDTGVVIRFWYNSRSYGPLIGFSFGQYHLSFRAGYAHLWERCRPKGGGDPRWRERFGFPLNVGPFGALGVHEVQLMVFPVIGPRGELYLNFVGKGLTRSTQIPGMVGGTNTSSPTERVWQASPQTRGDDEDAAPGHVTAGGQAIVYANRQVDVDWQFSRLIFDKYSRLTDDPHGASGPMAARYWGLVTVPGMDTRIVPASGPIPTDGPSLTAKLTTLPGGAVDLGGGVGLVGVYNGAALTAKRVRPTFGFHGVDIPANFSGYCRRPAILWGYVLGREEVRVEIAPGEFDMDLQEAHLAADEGDARQIGGVARVIRTSASPTRSARLLTRGAFTAQVTTQWVPPGGDPNAPLTLRLFRGEVDRAAYERFPPHEPDQFPGEEWGVHDLPLLGPSKRLQDRTSRTLITLRRYAYDTEAGMAIIPPLNVPMPLPWKVTRVIRDLLMLGGFGLDQIDIPDLPIRLFMGLGADTSHLVVDACTSLAERAVRLARNYLGMVLVFDAAAGTRGQWKLIAPPPEGTAPIYHFVLEPPAGRDVIAPHLPSHYPANTTFARDVQQLRKIAPEGNHLWIFTAPDHQRTGGFKYERHFYNDEAYQVPGFSTTPDPDSPHYTDGCESIIACPMPELFQGDDRPALTYHALMAVGWRIFNYSCRARHIRTIRAPLWPIQDPTGGYWRPLRYGDPVSYNGQAGWFVNTPGIEIQADPNQEQTLEIMRLCPLRSLPAGV